MGQSHLGVGDVMAASAQKRLHADGAVVAQRDSVDGVDLHPWADCSVLAHREHPRVTNAGRRIDVAGRLDSSTEESEQESPPRECSLRAKSKQSRLDDRPQKTTKFICKQRLILVLGQVQIACAINVTEGIGHRR